MIATGLLFLAATAGAPTQTTFARDIDVRQPVTGRIVAVLSDVRIASRVSGDVIVWGGSVTFLPSGSVGGNLSVFGGRVSVPAGRSLPVAGLVSTPGTLLRVYLDEMHRAPWQEGNRVLTRALRLIALSVWLAMSLALLFCFATPFSRAAAFADGDWTRTLLAGALGVLTLLLATVSALALLPGSVSVPLAILLGALAVSAKIFGMGALFLLLGQKIVKSVAPAKRPAALAVGLGVLGIISLVPFVGTIVWSAASVAAVGIAFLSRFGTPRYKVAIP